ncbi:MAG: hypothetical protein WCK76_09465 [Elusimicrobiota bacterium]
MRITMLLTVMFGLTGITHAAGGAAAAAAANPPAAFTRSEADYARTNPGYFTLNPASIRITRLAEAEEADFSYLNGTRTPLGDIEVILDQLINIGAKVWDIIKLNAPVADISTNYAAVVPRGITEWNQLAEWKKPKSYLYGFSARNMYGTTIIDVKYKVIFAYGGAYHGKGRYLTGVTMLPSVTNIAWGYRFHLAAQVPDSTIMNVGTDADPVAALQLKTDWKISTTIKDNSGASAYYMQGDGYFEEL